MSDAYVQVAPDSTGKKIQTFENTVSGNLVESQAVVLVNSSGAPITPVTGAGGSNTQVQYNASGAFGGISGATTDGTKMTLVTPAITTGFSLDGSTLGGMQLFLNGTYFDTASPLLISPTLRFRVAGITVLTAGSPADVAIMTMPSWVTSINSPPSSPDVLIGRATAATGTLASGNWVLRDTAGGGGNALSATLVGPTAAGVQTWVAGATGGVGLSGSLYIRQTQNSLNSGTMTFYVTIFKL